MADLTEKISQAPINNPGAVKVIQSKINDAYKILIQVLKRA
jgi:hypothetical protein